MTPPDAGTPARMLDTRAGLATLMRMSSRALRFVLCLLMTAAAAGCRQPDGAMPVAEGETPNQIQDVARDLLAVARRDPDGRTDLVHDLEIFAHGRAAGEQAAATFGGQVAEAIGGRMLSDQAAQQLAYTVWTAIEATELSARQVDTLQNDLFRQLVSIGLSEQDAQQVAAGIETVQAGVTTRPRRWYEWF